MTTARRDALERVGFIALVVAALVVFLMRVRSLEWGLTAEQLDSLALARALARGDGLRWTPWSSTTEGPLNLVWLVIETLLVRLGAAPELWLPRIASSLLGASLVVVALRGAWVWRRAPRVEDALPALGLAFTTAMAEAGALGSGAALWVLAVSGAAVALGRWLGTGSSRVMGVVVGLLTVFRPSGVWLLVATLPAWWISSRLEGRKAGRETLIFLLGGGLVAGTVLTARELFIGSLPFEGGLPSQEGVALTVEFLSNQSRWIWAALALTLLAAVWRRFHLRGGGTLLAWVLMTVVLATWTHSPPTLALGCLPLLAMLVGEGLASAREEAAPATEQRTLRTLAWVGFVAGTLLLWLAASASYRLAPIMRRAEPFTPRPELREELSRRALRQPLIAWLDGAEGAELFPDARLVVFQKGTQAFDDLLVSEGPPDLVDPRLDPQSLPRTSARMSPKEGGARWLTEQSPDDDPRCPDGRLALLSTSPELLADQLARDVTDEQFERALSRWRCALAALDATGLPTLEHRQELISNSLERARELESVGRLELAVRASSLASELSNEDVGIRARTERLRRKWLRTIAR